MDKKKKLVFQLDTPYSAAPWYTALSRPLANDGLDRRTNLHLLRPQILPKDQDTILELLCNLLSPLGHYRSQHIHPSKGNRSKKRKRKEQCNKETALPVPPVPELKSYVDIGLSRVTRTLQETTSKGTATGSSQGGQNPTEQPASRFYSVIFIARSGQPNALSSHLPQMVAVASKAHPSQPPTRLVELPRACEGRLHECLGIPRVSCIGICVDAPNSNALVDFTREHVPVVKVPWLEEAACAEFRATKINTIQTTVGTRKKKKRTLQSKIYLETTVYLGCNDEIVMSD